MIDVGCSLALVLLLVAVVAAYVVRVLFRGEAHYARVEAAGSSPLLGRRLMEMAYWSLQPVARLCIRLGLGPNAITGISMGLALLAAVALAFGHFGVAALLTAVASLGDALDGLVARSTGAASGAGEVLDATVDRYSEGAFLTGLAIYFHDSVAMLCIVLAAILGSFMVSYATAKAEASQAEVPRGWMRRSERAVYLNVGVALVPLAGACLPNDGAMRLVSTAPIALAVGIVALFSNVSAIRRLRALARTLRARDAASPLPRAPLSGDEQAEEQGAAMAASATTSGIGSGATPAAS